MQRILLEDRRGKHVSNDERSSIGSAYRKRYSIMMAGCHQPLASHVVKKTNGWCVQATASHQAVVKAVVTELAKRRVSGP